MNISDDVKVFLNDFAITFVADDDGVERRGIFEEENSPIGFGVEGRRISLTTHITNTTNINHSTTILLQSTGLQYTVIGLEPIDDGEFIEIILRL